MVPFLVSGNQMVPIPRKRMRSHNEKISITALEGAILWFQSRQYYGPTATISGCVAKTSGSLVKVAFVLTALSHRHPTHEPQATMGA